jgi:hypothetical protein
MLLLVPSTCAGVTLYGTVLAVGTLRCFSKEARTVNGQQGERATTHFAFLPWDAVRGVNTTRLFLASPAWDMGDRHVE